MRWITGYCLACIVGIVAALLWLDGRVAADAATQRESILQAKYATAVIESERVADTVVRTVRRVSYLRDTVLARITDTAYVTSFVLRVDTLLVSCERCASQLRALRVSSDSLLAAKDLRIASLRPTWRDRCGVSLGAGILRDGTTVRAGPTLSLGCRLW